MDDQKRFTLAMALSGLILAAYFFLYLKPAAERTSIEKKKEIEALNQQKFEQVVPPQERSALITEGTRIKIDSPKLHGSFSTTGMRFDDLTLKEYKQELDPNSPDVIMFTPEGAEHASYVFDNWVANIGESGSDHQWAVISGTVLTMETPVVLKYTADNYTAQRTVSIDDHYLITLKDVVTNTSSKEISLVRKGTAKQHGLPDDLTNFYIIQEGPIAIVDDHLEKIKYKKLEKKTKVQHQGKAGWVGLTDRYWLAAAIAPQDQNITADFEMEIIQGQNVYEASYATKPITFSPGEAKQSTGYIYAGAKERILLKTYETTHGIAQMERAIDWGIFRILTRPMSWALTKLGALTGNFGFGILLLTLVVKILLFPLNNKAYASMAKMKLVQPKLKKLQARYEDDRGKLQQEMMALYRKEGVSPVAGCLPMIPQAFIFFALYKSLFITLEMRHAPFIGYLKDLSAKDPLSILNGFGVLPWDAVPIAAISILALGPLAIMYGITMGLMQTLNTPPADKIQARLFQLMPIFFTFILGRFAAGLLLYWVWNNLLTLIQQYYITRKFKVETPLDKFFAKLKSKETKSANDG
ncbi:MAG: membrane protein insertase YidC [Robiginitomaculum sp.]